uniref:Uncharacterized protein n=1 Tax=Arundo donax TaxID=35708 RepID=A0A0A8Z2D5_ARUDO
MPSKPRTGGTKLISGQTFSIMLGLTFDKYLPVDTMIICGSRRHIGSMKMTTKI